MIETALIAVGMLQLITLIGVVTALQTLQEIQKGRQEALQKISEAFDELDCDNVPACCDTAARCSR